MVLENNLKKKRYEQNGVNYYKYYEKWNKARIIVSKNTKVFMKTNKDSLNRHEEELSLIFLLLK